MTSEVDTEEPQLSKKVAESAVLLITRRFVITGFSAIAAVIVARELGPGTYGPYASALAIYAITLAASDLGFSLVLGRDLARFPERQSELLTTAVRVHLVWAGSLATILVAIGLASGPATVRGGALLVLAPSVFVSGLVGLRQLFFVNYQVRVLALIDVPVNLAMLAFSVVGVLWLGFGAVAIAAVTSAFAILNTLAVAGAARSYVRRVPVPKGASAGFIKLSWPLGMSSFLATLYFSLDMVLLGWIVSGDSLGHYAVAVKVLSFIVMVPNLVMAAVLPALAVSSDRHALGAMAARVWHWLLISALPLCVFVALLAEPFVSSVFGASYVAAVEPLRVLCLAGVLALASNVLGIVLVSEGLARPQLVQNTAAIAASVVGMFVLVPEFGIMAAAWLTVLSELIVVAGGAYTLRHRVDFVPIRRATWRPLVAVGLGAAASAALVATPALAAAAGAAVFAGTALVVGAWPEEFRRRRPSGSAA